MTDDGDDPEQEEEHKKHVEFMIALKNMVEDKIGKEPMVAVSGDINNGVYCIYISMITQPPAVVLATCAAMTSANLKDMLYELLNKTANVGPKPTTH